MNMYEYSHRNVPMAQSAWIPVQSSQVSRIRCETHAFITLSSSHTEIIVSGYTEYIGRNPGGATTPHPGKNMICPLQ